MLICIFVLCRVDAELQVKVADFGLTRDIYATDYYRQSHHGRVPVKWMSLESLHDKISNEKTDVVSSAIVYYFTSGTILRRLHNS